MSLGRLAENSSQLHGGGATRFDSFGMASSGISNGNVSNKGVSAGARTGMWGRTMNVTASSGMMGSEKQGSEMKQSTAMVENMKLSSSHMKQYEANRLHGQGSHPQSYVEVGKDGTSSNNYMAAVGQLSRKDGGGQVGRDVLNRQQVITNSVGDKKSGGGSEQENVYMGIRGENASVAGANSTRSIGMGNSFVRNNLQGMVREEKRVGSLGSSRTEEDKTSTMRTAEIEDEKKSDGRGEEGGAMTMGSLLNAEGG